MNLNKTTDSLSNTNIHYHYDNNPLILHNISKNLQITAISKMYHNYVTITKCVQISIDALTINLIAYCRVNIHEIRL